MQSIMFLTAGLCLCWCPDTEDDFSKGWHLSKGHSVASEDQPRAHTLSPVQSFMPNKVLTSLS